LVTEGGSYTVTVTNNNGCSSISNTIEIIQDPDETPIIFVQGETTFCFGSSGVILTSSDAEGYLWSNGKFTKSIQVFNSGEFSVTVPGLCGDFTSQPVVVTAIHPVDPIAINDTISNIPGIATPGVLGTANYYQWYYEFFAVDPFFIGQEFDTLIYETTVFYVEAVFETNDVVCESDRVEVWAVVDTTTSIIIIDEVENINIYPNPTSRVIVIDFENGVASEIELDIFDINGKIVFSKTIEPGFGPRKEIISFLDLASGIYTISLLSNKNRYVQKLIVQNE